MENVTKRFGGKTAVDGLSLEVKKGQVMGLLGPNGAGKSTTLHMLAGLVHPTHGRISLFGKLLRPNFTKLVSRVGFVLERPRFFEYLSVRRNLRLHGRLAGRGGNSDRALDLAGLLHASEERAGNLSTGMRQRLAIAMAILTEPELLILDEPTNGLDVEAAQEVMRLLQSLAADARVSMLISSHQMHEVEQVCDAVTIINEGAWVACEQTARLLSHDMTHLEVLVDRADSAAKRLATLPWVLKAEPKGSKLEVHLTEGHAHQLNALLVGEGYRVSGVMPRRRTLQDYFLRMMNE